LHSPLDGADPVRKRSGVTITGNQNGALFGRYTVVVLGE
jgi:hypothetical protein